MRVISRFGLGLGFGLGAAVAQIQYLLRLALNPSNTAPLTALTGTNATQVATSSVTVVTEAGLLETIAANLPAIEGANYAGSGTWTVPDGVTATVLSSGMTRYTGNTYGQPGLGVLAEPAMTNKCTCQKANPTATTNITKTGDAASVLSIVDDTAALTAAGLIGICTLGDVYKLDNSAGTASAYATIAGNTTNTNTHTASIYWRGSGAGGAFVSGASAAAENAPAAYARQSLSQIPSSTTNTMSVRAAPGAIVYFILPQLEESAVATSPIYALMETTAAVTRAARYATIAGSELGTDFHVDANVKNLGTEMALIGDPTSLAYLYKNSADKVVWRGSSLGDELVTNGTFDSDTTGYTTVNATLSVTADYTNPALRVTKTNTNGQGRTTISTVAGKTYAFSAGLKGRTTGAVSCFFQVGSTVAASDLANYVFPIWTTSGTATGRFRATGTTTYINLYSAAATGTEDWDNITVQEVKELTSTSSLAANTPAIIGVHQGTDGATLYVNGTAEATDATMTTPVTFGTTVRLGADTAATAGSVCNGSVSLIHSANAAIANEVN